MATATITQEQLVDQHLCIHVWKLGAPRYDQKLKATVVKGRCRRCKLRHEFRYQPFSDWERGNEPIVGYN